MGKKNKAAALAEVEKDEATEVAETVETDDGANSQRPELKSICKQRGCPDATDNDGHCSVCNHPL